MRKTEDTSIKRHLDRAIAAINTVFFGKQVNIRLALACLIARGHLLIEDMPGVGKTTLAHTLAKILGLHYQRIQFTSDLLPADILGTSIYRRDNGRFEFHPGPVFTQVLLADEINRATPRTQSALLEAMAESQVTVDGKTRRLTQPFFVIATQNPATQIGTFPLPESQLDRFLMRLHLGYPDSAAEYTLLTGGDSRKLLSGTDALMNAEQLTALQKKADTVHVANPLFDYIQALLEYSRHAAEFSYGLSPRAGLAILHAAKAWALIHGHKYVAPEDVQVVLPSVIGHRLSSRDQDQQDAGAILLKQVAVL